MTGQLSLFGVEAGQPAVADLEGLLVGPGQVTRMGGTARVAVAVPDRWRASALLAEVRARGLPASAVARADATFEVRTAYAAALAPLAAHWLDAGAKRAPSPLRLDGRRLRLWMIAAGYHDGVSVELRLGPGEERVWVEVRRALAGLGLSAELVGAPPAGPATGTALSPGPGAGPPRPGVAGPGAADSGAAGAGVAGPGAVDSSAAGAGMADPGAVDSGAAGAGMADPAAGRSGPGAGRTSPTGPGYRITDRRRLARLAELVGGPPAGAPPGAWPLVT